MIGRLRPRDRRALSLGAAAFLAIGAWSFALRPLRSAIVERSAAVDRNRSLLARERALLRLAPDLPARLAASDSAARGWEDRLFPGVDAVAATASLGAQVAAAARAAGVRLERTTGRPPRGTRAGLTELRVALDASGDVASVMRMLDALENGPRLVRVERLAVRANAGGGDDGLDVSLDAVGYGIGSTARDAAGGAR